MGIVFAVGIIFIGIGIFILLHFINDINFKPFNFVVAAAAGFLGFILMTIAATTSICTQCILNHNYRIEYKMGIVKKGNKAYYAPIDSVVVYDVKSK